MPTTKYLLSFTAASLSYTESVKVAEVYSATRNWEETKESVLENNLLQSRTISRSSRTYLEVSKRLKQLSKDQLEVIIEGSIEDQKYMLWFAICQTYEYIKEFAVEVLHEKFSIMDYHLTDLDYGSFYNEKLNEHEELETVTTTTKNKLKQVIFKMLEQADLISDDHIIIPAMLSPRLVNSLLPVGKETFRIFPIYESIIEEF